jgi:protocatechuate 3,4-dioxygenase beta subunit
VIPYQQEGAITFQVVDADTGAPLEEFRVEAGLNWPIPLTNDDGRPLTQHEDGYVRVGNLRPSGNDSEATLRISQTGYEEFELEDVAVALGSDTDLGTIRLTPVPTVRVTVVDDRTGLPIERVHVSLEEQERGGRRGGRFTEISMTIGDDDDSVPIPWRRGGAITDENGVAIVNSLEGRTATIRGMHGDYAPASVEDVQCPVGESLERTLRMTKGGSVLVTVLDSAGLPMKGARVEHRVAPDPDEGGGRVRRFGGFGRGRDKGTDADGTVLFDQLVPGAHEFRLSKGGGGGWAGGDVMIRMSGGEPDESWTPAQVAEGQVAAVTLHAQPSSVLSGKITESGQPLVGATVQLAKSAGEADESSRMIAAMMPAGMGGGTTARTDSEGRYEFEDVEVGSYTLTVEHPTRRMPASEDLEVREGSTGFDVDLPISIVEGRVLDSDGKPVPGIKVEARTAASNEMGRGMRGFAMMFSTDDGGSGSVVEMGGGSGGDSATTDQDGRFTLRGVTPDVELVVHGEGGDVQPGDSEPFEVGPNQTRRGIELVLDAGGSLEIEAFKADGTAAGMCLVNATWAGDDSVGVDPKMSFMQSGKTTLRGLRPGPWNVSINPVGPGNDDDGEVSRVVEVVARETKQEAFHLP